MWFGGGGRAIGPHPAIRGAGQRPLVPKLGNPRRRYHDPVRDGDRDTGAASDGDGGKGGLKSVVLAFLPEPNGCNGDEAENMAVLVERRQGLSRIRGAATQNRLFCSMAPWARTLVAAALLTLGLAGTAVQAAEFESPPHQLVAQTAKDLAALVRASQGYAQEDPERFFTEVDALLAPAVDFQGFARGVMAAHYRQATPEQRRRFAETFKWSLIRAYALALTDFTDGEVVVLPPDGPPKHPRRRAVRTEIRTGTGIYPVIYTTTLGQDGAWRIGNINIAGVNIGLTYRSQFTSMAADHRYDGNLDRIIDAWAEFVGKGLGSFVEDPAATNPRSEAKPP